MSVKIISKTITKMALGSTFIVGVYVKEDQTAVGVFNEINCTPVVLGIATANGHDVTLKQDATLRAVRKMSVRRFMRWIQARPGYKGLTL